MPVRYDGSTATVYEKTSDLTAMKQLCLGVIVAIGLTLPALGRERPVINLLGIDPLIGTWKLNLEKSTVNFPLQKA